MFSALTEKRLSIQNMPANDLDATASSYPLQPESHRQDCGFTVLY